MILEPWTLDFHYSGGPGPWILIVPESWSMGSVILEPWSMDFHYSGELKGKAKA